MGRQLISDLVKELAGICGAEHVCLDGGTVYVAPKSTAEVATVLRYAHEYGLVVTPWGGGTKQAWCESAQPSICMQMHRMDQVLEHPWQDMTCTVEAGCTWAAMQAGLAAHGQFVALDPLFAERATVGGIVATNDSGSLRLRYGSLRDLIIGMTIVLADGTIAKTGGKVVKNVAGYDLHKLMTGAFGTLGVMTEITFRLHSIARHTRDFTVNASEAEPLGRLLLQVTDSHLSTQSVQLRTNAAGFSLDVRLAALPEVMEAQSLSLGAMAEAVGLTAHDAEMDVWRAREEIFEQEANGFVVKITMMPTEIAAISAAVRELGGRSVTQAVGVMIAVLPKGVAELRKRVEAGQGSLIVLRQSKVETLDRWGRLPDTLPLMREIKQRFDPKQILNPGRFLGGI